MKNCIKIFAIVLLFSFNVLCLNGCIQNQIVDQIDNAVLLGNDFAGSSQIRYESSDDVAIGSSIYTYRQYSVDRLETIQKPDTKLYFIYQKKQTSWYKDKYVQ